MYHFIRESENRKTGPIPVVYSARETCPPSCAHYRADCYAEDFFTRMTWDKVPQRGGTLADLVANLESLPTGQLWRLNIAGDLPGKGEAIDPRALGWIIRANFGKRGFTYTHKRSREAIKWATEATRWGFTVNLSADDAGEADTLAATGLPVACIVPKDTPERSTTPGGLPIVVCPAQTRDTNCNACGLCQRANRKVIVGFRAHGTRAKTTDARARRVIPIARG
jgi:hypothetical protein